MSGRDVWRYVFAFFVVTGLQWVFANLLGHTLDDWDHTHALIMAGVYVIVKAIRSAKTMVRIIGSGPHDNWEAEQ